jgi:glycine hydroxymethyltransferase
MKETEMRQIAEWIGEALGAPEDESLHAAIRERVKSLCQQFPIYGKRLVRSREAIG